MAFLRSTSAVDAEAEIHGRERVPAPPRDGRLLGLGRAAGRMSRQHLTVWEPQWARDELTRSAFRRRLRQYQRELREDQGYAFLIFRQADAALVGGLSISNVRRGVAQAASIGYWIGAPHVRRGHMTDAVKAVLPFAFGTLGLHRLEAACLPHNHALHARAGEGRLQARRHGAPLPEDQRRLAGSRSLRAAARRCAACEDGEALMPTDARIGSDGRAPMRGAWRAFAARLLLLAGGAARACAGRASRSRPSRSTTTPIASR